MLSSIIRFTSFVVCACAGSPTAWQLAYLASAVPGQSGSPVQLSAQSADPEQLYLDALRQRKLYRLLELYCRKQLARPELARSDRVRYAIELADVLAVRAGEQTDLAVRSELWQQAWKLLEEFLERNADHPDSAGLQFRLGVLSLAQGELLRQQALVAPQPQAQELGQSARTLLLSAVESLQAADRRAGQLLPEASPTAGQPDDRQLRTLSTNARFRLGQAWLALAGLSPRHSADRTEFAGNAKAEFQAFTLHHSSSPIVLESFLSQAESLLLLGDPPALREAIKSLRAIENQETPDGYRDRALLLHARIQLEQSKASARRPGVRASHAVARQFIQDAQNLLQAPTAEMDLLNVEATLLLARERSEARDHLVAQQLVDEAVRATERIEQAHGKYWLARCELLLADLAATKVLVQDPSILRRIADGQYRKGDRRGAVATLDWAVKLAAEQAKVDQAVDLGLRAASVQIDAGELAQAAERCAALAERYPNHPRAAQAHFLAAYCLGQAYAAEQSPEQLERYEQALEQHLRQFASGPTVAESRWLLGSLRMTQRRWPAAVELLSGVPPQHTSFPSARLALGEAYESWLLELWSRSEPSETVLSQAIAYMRKVQGTGSQLRREDVPLALRLARILVHPSVGRYTEAEEVLEAILFGKAADEAGRRDARRLEVIALVGQDKFEAAGRMLQTEFVGMPQELFAVVRSLEDAAERSQGIRRRRIGRLQLVAAQRLAKNPQQLSEEQKLETQILLALALVNAGESNRAEELFSEIHKLVPNTPRVIQAQAECYMQLGRYDGARKSWRELIGLLPENTPPWFRAKYSLAEACFHSGDLQQCGKIIRITRLLHPDLGGPELKARFEELEAKCR